MTMNTIFLKKKSRYSILVNNKSSTEANIMVMDIFIQHKYSRVP